MDYSNEFKVRFIERFGFDRLGFFALDLTGWPTLILEHQTGTVHQTLAQSTVVVCTETYEPVYACYSWEGEITLYRDGQYTLVLRDGESVHEVSVKKGILHLLYVKNRINHERRSVKTANVSSFAIQAAKLFDPAEQLAKLSWLQLLSEAEKLGLKVRCQKGYNRKVVTQNILEALQLGQAVA